MPWQDTDTAIKEGSLVVFPLRMKVKTATRQQPDRVYLSTSMLELRDVLGCL